MAIIDREAQIKECSEFATLLEKSPFSDLKKILKSLIAADYQKYKRFYEYLSDLSLWGEINRHKIYLAIFVARESNVVALQEDRTRIVLSLARAYGKSLAEANAIFAKEFGDYFQLKQTYTFSGKTLSFREITKKAAEIKNGLKNISYLTVEENAKEIMVYFKNSSNNDKAKLLKLKEATFSLMMKMRDPIAFMRPDMFNEVKPELEEYYRLTNRAEIDIKALGNNPDFDEIAKFVYMMAEVVVTKLKLLEKNYAPDDLKKAEEIVFTTLASIDFKSHLSVEEIRRTGMPLPKKA